MAITSNRKPLFTGGAFLFILLGINLLFAEDKRDDYINSLIKEIEIKKLYLRREWFLLLHYKKKLFGIESEVDGKSFFLSPKGKYDPKSEMIETIKAFFKKEIPKEKEHPICAFIARFKWLKKQLNIDENMLPKVECREYKKWRKKLNPESASLIFSSYYLNNPASMFGHTMIKINQNRKENPELLDFAFTYGANPTTNNIILYILYGIFGGFKGTFAMRPYFVKVREYNDIENRDLWEYRLNLKKEELDRLIDHLWELGDTFFYYYYFDENCSYHLLSLLEVARPTVHLRDKFMFIVHPAETVKVVAKEKMIEKTIYRPSLFSKYKTKFRLLKKREISILEEIVKGDINTGLDSLKKLKDDRKALILDTAIDYMLYTEKDKKDRKRYNRILIARSKIEKRPEIKYYPLVNENPLLGHKPAHISIGLKRYERKDMIILSYFPSLRKLEDRDLGYSPYSQIVFGEVSINILENHIYLDNLKFLDIISLAPLKYLIYKPSWNFSTGIESLYSINQKEEDLKKLEYFIKGGIGITIEPVFEGLIRQFAIYTFINAALLISNVYKDYTMPAMIPTVGAIIRLTENIILKIEGETFLFSYENAITQEKYLIKTTAKIHIHILKNLAIDISINNTENRKYIATRIEAYI